MLAMTAHGAVLLQVFLMQFNYVHKLSQTGRRSANTWTGPEQAVEKYSHAAPLRRGGSHRLELETDGVRLTDRLSNQFTLALLSWSPPLIRAGLAPLDPAHGGIQRSISAGQ